MENKEINLATLAPYFADEDKAPVVTLVERNGRVKYQYMESVTGENLKNALIECVEIDTCINTDEYVRGIMGPIHNLKNI